MSSQFMGAIQFLSTARPLATIVLFWLIRMGVVGLLQAFGTGIGFHIWAMGEDRNWLGFMMDGHGVHMVREFWKMNDRNPLSAWWWLAASPVIHATDWGLYLVRTLVDPFLAITTFLLLDRLARKRARAFALSVSIVVLMWNFSSYHEQIMWDMLGSLGLSMLSICFYCRYIDDDRIRGSDLGYALAFYFIAIATYTLHSGAILVIGLLSLFRRVPTHAQLARRGRILTTIQDTGCFAVMLVGFICIWYTSARPSSSYYQLHLSLVGRQLVESIRYFVWHYDYSPFLKHLLTSWPAGILTGTLLIAGGIYATLLAAPVRRMTFDQEIMPVGWVVALLVGIALPIIAVESTSAVWLPGYRSRMVQQIFQPLLYVACVFFLAQLVGRWHPRVVQAFILTAVAGLGAIAVALGFDYNRQLVEQTKLEKSLAEGLGHISVPEGIHPYFLVKMDHAGWRASDSLSDVYGRTMLGRSDVSLRILQRDLPPDPEWSAWWRVRFAEREVSNAKVGSTAPVDYRQVWIVVFDGERVSVPAIVRKEDLAGLQIDWQRSGPIYQDDVR